MITTSGGGRGLAQCLQQLEEQPKLIMDYGCGTGSAAPFFFESFAEALLLDKDTEIPPVGAAPLKVTVPVGEVPPGTLVGFTESEERATVIAGVMVSAAVLLTPL